MMLDVLLESRRMGRPKKNIPSTSTRIEVDAYDLARKASGFTGENIIDYISRVVREQADRDVTAGSEKYLRDAEAARKSQGGDKPKR